jgi:LEA14-like dessication related protein
MIDNHRRYPTRDGQKAGLILKYSIFPLMLILCSCMPKYTVFLKDVNITHIALDKTDFDAKVWVTYRWFHSVTLTDITYQLYYDNKKFGDGAYPGKIVLGKNADTLLTLPCTAKNQSLALPLFDALLKSDFDYEVIMQLKVKAGLYQKRTNVKYWGTRKMW